jgi:hypothetical protein
MINISQKYSRLALIVFTLSAIMYNSWPLGYILNPKTAHIALASDLNGVGQPFYWLFILGDVLVGTGLLAISILLFFKLRNELWSNAWLVVFVGVLLFGVFTATSAASTNSCLPGHFNMCATIDNKTFGADGLESALAAVGLLVSLIGINLMSVHFKLSKRLMLVSQVMLLAWPLSGLIFLWAADVNDNIRLAQHALLIISGLSLFVIGLDIYAAIERQASSRQIKEIQIKEIH